MCWSGLEPINMTCGFFSSLDRLLKSGKISDFHTLKSAFFFGFVFKTTEFRTRRTPQTALTVVIYDT